MSKRNLKKQSQTPAFGRKSEILSPKSETDRMEAKRQIPAHFKECDLKKQTHTQTQLVISQMENVQKRKSVP